MKYYIIPIVIVAMLSGCRTLQKNEPDYETKLPSSIVESFEQEATQDVTQITAPSLETESEFPGTEAPYIESDSTETSPLIPSETSGIAPETTGDASSIPEAPPVADNTTEDDSWDAGSFSNEDDPWDAGGF